MANKINDKQINSGMGEALFSDRERFEMWFAENWKKTAAVSLIIVIAISAAFGITGYIADRKAAGAAELSAATAVETLKAAIEKNAGNPAVAIAQLRMANMLFDEKKYDEAISYLKKISANTSADAVLVATAKLNIAKALELSGKTNEAINAFATAAIAANDNSAIKSEAVFGAARLLAKQGKTADALAEIKKLNQLTQGVQNSMNPYAADAAALEIAIESGEYGKIQ